MSPAELLSPRDLALVDAVAARVLELIDERETASAGLRLVSAGAVARMLGVARSFVYDHADELGVTRLGTGPKAQLRFDPEQARAAMSRSKDKPSDTLNATGDGASAAPRTRRRRGMPNGLPQPGSVLSVRDGRGPGDG